jgi:APA family basic amino acid/polyamine antiporter
MSDQTFSIIDEQIGLVGGTLLLVGNVVAMTAFLLPAHLIAEDGVGPEIALAMVAVALPVTFSILITLQLGGAMPAAGGSYVYGSRLVHPFFGFLLPWMVVPAIWLGQLYLAFGFAEFVRFFPAFEWLPMWALMYAVLVPFVVLNVLGIRLVTQVQMVLVGIIVAGMLLFIVPGAATAEPSNYSGMFDAGVGPFFVALISLTIAMHGFTLATDLGEELENPVKNIPRVLALSAVVSIGLMTALVVVAVGVVPTEFYVAEDGSPVEAGVAVAAFEFLPDWGANLVALAAVVGAFTSINTLYTSYSRQLMRAARDEAIPGYFAGLHRKYGTPHRAILLLALPALVLVVPVSQTTPVVMAAILAMSTLIGTLIGSVALWNLPKRFEQRYEHSLYRLPRPVLRFVAIAGALVAGLFLLGVSVELGWLVAAVLGWMVLAYPVYRYRVRSLRGRGVDLHERMAGLHSHERERAATGARPARTDDRVDSEGVDGESPTDG